MIHSACIRVSDQSHALWKLLLSFFKQEWLLHDYPIAVREQSIDPSCKGTRLKQHKFRAYVVNWALDGLGDTADEAMEDLGIKFQSLQARRQSEGLPMIRPGMSKPIEFASQNQIAEFEELSQNFLLRIFDIEDAWVSDESSLWDFHMEDSNEIVNAKIQEAYGVDVSDIRSGNLVEIYRRIANAQKTE